jgi:hypothetical protein
MGPRAVFHERPEEGAQANQRQVRDGGDIWDVQGGIREATLPGSCAGVLRVAR